jgi:hypothetical protein
LCHLCYSQYTPCLVFVSPLFLTLYSLHVFVSPLLFRVYSLPGFCVLFVIQSILPAWILCLLCYSECTPCLVSRNACNYTLIQH